MAPWLKSKLRGVIAPSIRKRPPLKEEFIAKAHRSTKRSVLSIARFEKAMDFNPKRTLAWGEFMKIKGNTIWPRANMTSR